MIHLAVFLLSLSSLAFEVLLTRIFSISQWNHLSFMVISIALFGFAASGTCLSILDARLDHRRMRLISRNAVSVMVILYTLTAIGSFLALNQIPLDYFRIPLEPVQGLYLLTTYLLLSLPFFFTGFVISIAYSFSPEKTGLIYFASMTGSACGAFIPIPFLPLWGEGKLIIISAIIPMALVFIELMKTRSDSGDRNDKRGFLRGEKRFLLTLSAMIFLPAAYLLSPNGDRLVHVTPSPYKAISQVLQYPHTHIVKTVTGIEGRFDTVKSRYVRFAPGLSLKFADTLPRQWTVYRDGDHPFTLYRLLSDTDAQFASAMLQSVGYQMRSKIDRVLLIQSGGGSGIICALASGAKKITIVEQHPEISRIVQAHYHLPVTNENPRSFLGQSHQLFDIIHVENWGASLPGTAALTQGHLFTVEAFTEYLSHLTPNGLIIISRRLLLPPADSVRLWATAYESLKSLKIKSPETHLAVLRNWDTFTLVVSAQPIQETRRIKSFASRLNFDLVYLPDISEEMTNRFNVFDAPYHFLDIRRLSEAYRSKTEKAFFRSHLLDIRPQKDRRPFPSRFLKWSNIQKIYQSTGSRFYSLFMSGEIVVTVVFFEALMVAILLLVIPAVVISTGRKKPPVSQIIYFLSVGAGFMFVELFFIKAYTLVFGDPVLSLTVVLTGILVFSGIGGIFTPSLKQKDLKNALFVLIGVLILVFFGFDTLYHRILRFSSVTRYLLAILLLIPPGLLVGIPFPVAMQHLLKSPIQRAYGWTANGCASVLTAIASAQIALSQGIPAIILCAVLSYFLAFLCLGKKKRTPA